MNDPGSQNVEGFRPFVPSVRWAGSRWLFVLAVCFFTNIKPPELSATEVGFFLLLSLVVLNRPVPSMATAGKRWSHQKFLFWTLGTQQDQRLEHRHAIRFTVSPCHCTSWEVRRLAARALDPVFACGWCGALAVGLMHHSGRQFVSSGGIDVEPWSSVRCATGRAGPWHCAGLFPKLLHRPSGDKCHHFWSRKCTWFWDFCGNWLPLSSWLDRHWHLLWSCNCTMWHSRGSATECQCSLHGPLGHKTGRLSFLQGPSHTYWCSTQWGAFN